MYAIVDVKSKQYKMAPGEVVTLDNLPHRNKKEIEFKKVLLLADKKNVTVGYPLVKGAEVAGEVIRQGKGKKIKVFRYIKRENYHRTIGHRQCEMQVRIKEIKTGEK